MQNWKILESQTSVVLATQLISVLSFSSVTPETRWRVRGGLFTVLIPVFRMQQLLGNLCFFSGNIRTQSILFNLHHDQKRDAISRGAYNLWEVCIDLPYALVAAVPLLYLSCVLQLGFSICIHDVVIVQCV